jgi:hypothetical protein
VQVVNGVGAISVLLAKVEVVANAGAANRPTNITDARIARTARCAMLAFLGKICLTPPEFEVLIDSPEDRFN